MKTFVTSDLHFGHDAIIKYCNRPFKDVKDMEDKLIANWNSVVGENDLVYLLGDLTFKGDNPSKYLDRMNGRIILVKGNHDKYIKHEKIEMVKDYLEVRLDGVLYILSHYPILSWKSAFKNSVHLYGHVHASGKDWEFVNLPNAHPVCCEFHDYKPVELNKFKPVNFAESLGRMTWTTMD